MRNKSGLKTLKELGVSRELAEKFVSLAHAHSPKKSSSFVILKKRKRK
ncbi:hypothetical protein [Calidifontibacillus erzurumensis]